MISKDTEENPPALWAERLDPPTLKFEDPPSPREGVSGVSSEAGDTTDFERFCKRAHARYGNCGGNAILAPGGLASSRNATALVFVVARGVPPLSLPSPSEP